MVYMQVDERASPPYVLCMTSTLTLTLSLCNRIDRQRREADNARLYLRIMVESGGCSGFQYTFGWDDQILPDDVTYGDRVVIDETSLPFMAGATVDFVENLMGADFKVTNPKAVSGCGCGHSFTVQADENRHI